MLKEIDLLTAIEMTLAGENVLALFFGDEYNGVISSLRDHTLESLMKDEYRFLIDMPEEIEADKDILEDLEKAKADEVLENTLKATMENDTPSPDPETVSENSEKPKLLTTNHFGPRVDVGKINALYNAG